MSQHHISVEWSIGTVLALFPRLDLKQSQRVLLGLIGRDYLIAVLLRNAKTCYSGSQTSHYYGLQPPTLQEYFVHIN